MNVNEIIAEMFIQQQARDERERAYNSVRYSWIGHVRRGGDRAHKRWKRQRASGRR